MRALRGWRPPMIVIRVGIGVVMAAALSVAVVAETTAASSAGRHHGRSFEPKSHRQRVNHFNVGATHSPPRELGEWAAAGLGARGCLAGRGCGFVSAPERGGN